MNATNVSAGRVLVCAPLPPEHDRESGSRRIHHLIDLLRSEGWSVAFVCENAPADSPHVRHLRQRGVATYVGFDRHAKDLITAGDFDVAIFAFWYLANDYADLVRRLSPSTRIVVETVDLHWLRMGRHKLGSRNGTLGLLDERFASDFVAEQNTYVRADGVITVSEKEAALLNDMTGDPRLAYAVPDHEEMEPGTSRFSERRGILFLGNFRHPPNLDAVEYLCQDILPLLPRRLLREHPVSIVGNGADERVHDLAASCEGVQVVGWVPSVIPYLRAARISVVPLRYGAGTKRKLIQSLLAGTPTATTPAGTEGIDIVDEEHVLVGDDAPSFATAVERLMTDEALWTRLAENGRARIARLHDRAIARQRLTHVLSEVLSRPAKALTADWGDGRTRLDGSRAEAVRRAADAVVPPDSKVLVISRGDPELVKLPGRTASHFPQSEDGRYAGYHPADSRAAVAHLNELRRRADYLLLPSTSFWWLDYYAGFARHLRERFEPVWSDDDCVIFRLSAATNGGSSSAAAPADAAPSSGANGIAARTVAKRPAAAAPARSGP
jgi:glycosyltransferase involved in cell wall biosynthesis